MLLAAGALLFWAVPRGETHAMCFGSNCCAPHGGTSSSTGCNFYLCKYDFEDTWFRHLNCSAGSTASNQLCGGQSVCSASASADSNHNVSMGAYFCGGC